MQIFLCAIVLFYSCLAYSQEYEIRFDRPDKAGDRFQIESRVNKTMKRTIVSDGRVLNADSRNYEISLKGEQSVLEASEKGIATRIRVTIEQCTKMEGNASTPLLNQGDVIVAYRENSQKILHLNGKPMEKDLFELFDDVISVPRAGKPRDDEIFGPDRKVRVGEEWSIDRKLAAADFQEEGMKVLEENVKGTIKLNGITESEGKKFQEVSGTLSMTGVEFPLPDGFTVQQAEMTAGFSVWLPMDPEQSRTNDKGEMKMNAVASGSVNKDGRPIHLKMEIEATMRRSNSQKKL